MRHTHAWFWWPTARGSQRVGNFLKLNEVIPRWIYVAGFFTILVLFFCGWFLLALKSGFFKFGFSLPVQTVKREKRSLDILSATVYFVPWFLQV